ncbi:glycosyltransferase involved in cell wall biosynthesis [Novosphingobium chloroacetimidivorans]|uniref:Glycosyltransferase involved in cell wall biosynthesis n=1 Tax=Novosphingobium chloroacetimidivorans TaxID=1428314 RepID=A0A7W7K7Z6_9SPHN|nr:glycosyltransferase family 4 protein [Novosphingobium chloroacetimidivorans]MBB4857394.1 glycosyltransferase involved in cell wall biosynthesis [Novosphingobium chloroacetimidivorans]
MRILHLSMLYPPHILGGAERSVAMLAEAQTALGHRVAAACTTPGAFVREERNGVQVFRMPHETRFWAEEWPQHGKLERGWRKFSQQFNYRLRDHFARVIEEFAPDIVHTHSMVDVSTTVWEAAAERNRPIVHTLRDYDLLCADASMWHDGGPCGVKCKVMTFAKVGRHRLTDGVAAVGQETLEIHRRAGFFDHLPSDLQRVIWNPAVVEGAGEDYERPSREGQPFTIGYLGRINEEKGVGTLIDAARRLRPGNWQVVIAGKANNSLEPFVERAAGLPVTFPGFMDARAFFEGIDVMVAPSIWAEPLPRTILESYAMGVPAIGARSGGIPDLIGHDNAEWLFAPGDAEQLADRLQRAVDHGRERLPGKTAFGHVLRETRPPIVAERYLAFYRDVIAARLARAA